MADLVANITVAQFAPAMAYAACFVSPDRTTGRIIY
jgi:hypothetical protein